MRRHPALIPLSHEHHDILVVAQGLIRGRSPAPRSDWPANRTRQVARMEEFFSDVLEPHFRFEEAIVFPLAEQRLARGAALVRMLLREHDEVRSRLRTLRSDPRRDLDLRLPALGRLLVTHVRREERVLFEAMQRELDDGVLETVGRQLRARPTAGPSCHLPPAG